MGCSDLDFLPFVSKKEEKQAKMEPVTKMIAAGETTTRKKKKSGLAQRPEDLGVLSLSQGGSLGESLRRPMFG